MQPQQLTKKEAVKALLSKSCFFSALIYRTDGATLSYTALSATLFLQSERNWLVLMLHFNFLLVAVVVKEANSNRYCFQGLRVDF